MVQQAEINVISLGYSQINEDGSITSVGGKILASGNPTYNSTQSYTFSKTDALAGLRYRLRVEVATRKGTVIIGGPYNIRNVTAPASGINMSITLTDWADPTPTVRPSPTPSPSFTPLPTTTPTASTNLPCPYKYRNFWTSDNRCCLCENYQYDPRPWRCSTEGSACQTSEKCLQAGQGALIPGSGGSCTECTTVTAETVQYTYRNANDCQAVQQCRGNPQKFAQIYTDCLSCQDLIEENYNVGRTIFTRGKYNNNVCTASSQCQPSPPSGVTWVSGNCFECDNLRANTPLHCQARDQCSRLGNGCLNLGTNSAGRPACAECRSGNFHDWLDPCPSSCTPPASAPSAQDNVSVELHLEGSVIKNGTIVFMAANGQTYTVKTDENGDVKIDLPPGQIYQVTVSAPGYKSLTFTWNSSQGKEYFGNIKMEKVSSPQEGSFSIKEKTATALKVGLLKLTAGGHLFSLPVKPKQNLLASSLTELVASQKGEVEAISRWQNDRWETYLPKLGKQNFYDFPIEPGKAYFLQVAKNLFLEIEGEAIDQPLTLELIAGWNTVGLPKATRCPAETCTAEALLNLIDQQKPNSAQILSSLTAGFWRSVYKKEGYSVSLDFPLANDEGYFLKVAQPQRLTP